ncbi:hypothetical protein V865_000747 [Kwoniella europaea PYCC6329]|uniref:Uncharacterized protein n=1 Tax=Kwoniella europaea PYCC6329 TaxID=1423913 RepID=A0AAX4K8A8_9TREE
MSYSDNNRPQLVFGQSFAETLRLNSADSRSMQSLSQLLEDVTSVHQNSDHLETVIQTNDNTTIKSFISNASRTYREHLSGTDTEGKFAKVILDGSIQQLNASAYYANRP